MFLKKWQQKVQEETSNWVLCIGVNRSRLNFRWMRKIMQLRKFTRLQDVKE
jgi:hypothetical protein